VAVFTTALVGCGGPADPEVSPTPSSITSSSASAAPEADAPSGDAWSHEFDLVVYEDDSPLSGYSITLGIELPRASNDFVSVEPAVAIGESTVTIEHPFEVRIENTTEGGREFPLNASFGLWLIFTSDSGLCVSEADYEGVYVVEEAGGCSVAIGGASYRSAPIQAGEIQQFSGPDEWRDVDVPDAVASLFQEHYEDAVGAVLVGSGRDTFDNQIRFEAECGFTDTGVPHSNLGGLGDVANPCAAWF